MSLVQIREVDVHNLVMVLREMHGLIVSYPCLPLSIHQKAAQHPS